MLFAGILILAAGVARGQTLTNPDLSAIGDMRVVTRSSEAADSAGTRQLSFQFKELELALNAYLNPYMRADVFLGISGDGIEIEEANFTILRGLPLSLQFNAGKYLLDFGRINQQHSHQWAWIERPLMNQQMMGDEGLRVVGVRASTLIALGDNAVTITGSAFGSDAFAEEDAPDDGTPEQTMGNGRITVFRQLSDFWDLEVGGSFLAGEYDPAQSLSLQMSEADVKIKWRPDTYRALVWTGQVNTSQRDVAADDSLATVTTVDATGAFTSLELVWHKRWSAGGFLDWTQDPVVADEEAHAQGAFFAFSPAEETARFSLVFRHQTSDATDYADNSLNLQFLWALGPHKPHSF
jgi:hypothetical protein